MIYFYLYKIKRFAWFTFILYITTWVGENIYHGNPDAEENSPERNLFDVIN